MTDTGGIYRIRPLVIPPKVTPELQCQRTVDEMSPDAATNRKAIWRTKNAASRGLAADRCWRLAQVVINGERLCNQHAGEAALKLLLKEL